MSLRSVVCVCWLLAFHPSLLVAQTTLLGRTFDGTASHGQLPAMGGDGRFVVYVGRPALTDLYEQVVLVDCTTGSLERVSVNRLGAPADKLAWAPQVTTDGRFVAFVTDAANLAAPGEDTNGATDVYVRDRSRGFTERVSLGL